MRNKATRHDIYYVVLSEVRRLSGYRHIGADTVLNIDNDFFDSLDEFDLLFSVEQFLGIELHEIDGVNNMTIDELSDKIWALYAKCQ